MKNVYLIIILVATITTVITQDPPPVFDLPPPPPFEPPATDTQLDQPASEASNTSTVTVENVPIATNESTSDATLVDTILVDTNKSVVVSETNLGTNDSIVALPEPPTPGDNVETSASNATMSENTNDGITDISDTSSNLSSVKSDGNDTDLVNMTDIVATHQAISDILAAAAGNESVVSDVNVLQDSLNGSVKSVESLENIPALETSNITTNESLPMINFNATIPKDTVDMNATDPLTQIEPLEPLDFPPPQVPFEPVLEPELAVSGMETNISEIPQQSDLNRTLSLDSNDTSAQNKTYIDQVGINIDDATGNMTAEHTPVDMVEVASTAEQIPVDLPPVPVPVDLPPPPVDKPSVDFIESAGSTTIEISDLFAGLGSLDKSSPPMGSVILETTTAFIPTDASVSVPVIETTTQIPPGAFTTESSFVEYPTTMIQPTLETKDPIYRHVPEKVSPDHPPPIFSGGSRPSVYTDQFGPHDGHFPIPETTTPEIITTTKEAPPPPINLPTRPERRTNWPGDNFRTTPSPYTRWAAQSQFRQTTLNPRHMNVAELAAYALKMSNNRKLTNQPSQGIQVFFPTEPHTTQKPPTTLKPVYKQENVETHKNLRSNAFVEYLRKRYGISNIGTTPVYYTTTVKPIVKPLQRPDQRKFYNAQYLLSHLPESTTQKPTMKKFFDTKYLLSHLDFTKSKQVSPKTLTTMKPTTARHFFDAKYLLSHLDELQGPKSQLTLPPEQPVTKLSQHLPQRTNIQQLPQRTDFQKQGSVPSALQTWLNNTSIKSSAVSRIGLEQIQEPSIIMEQRQGQVETRPINLKSNINPQSFINYKVNPDQNVGVNLNVKQNRNHINPFTRFTTASFKPVVYGNKQFQMKKQSSGLSLRERFNRKWYHPEDKTPVRGAQKIRQSPITNEPIKNINIQIEQPVNRNQVITAPVSPVSKLQGMSQNVNKSIQNPISSRDIAIQHTNIELQRRILKQQEEKLRQQQQQLQEQQALLRLQEQQRNYQQQNQNPLLGQQEQDRLRLLHLQQQHNQNILLQQRNEEERLRLVRQQQQEEQQKQQLLLRQKERDRLRLLQQQQQRNQQLLLKQQEQERINQQQIQQRLQLEQQRQREQALFRRQQFNRQGDTFPLASRTGTSQILSNTQISNRRRHHTYQPDMQLSSIQIFKAPAMIKRRQTQEKKEAVPQTAQTHWSAPSDLKHLHGHLSVPYKLNPVQQTTQASPVPVATTQSPVVYIQTIAPTVRPVTSPRPTLPATADPNPPPIFDTKIRHTFMPMPNIEPTTNAPKSAGNVSGWDGSQGNNQQNNLQMDGRCRGCVFVNDRCLLPDPVHCHFYIECVKQGTSVRSFSRECALGSFFDRKSFLCVDPKNADCPTDRCRTPGTKWYAIHGHCKHYWSCGAREGGGVFAQSECCPEMGGFVDPVGCVENPNCTDTCSSAIVNVDPTGCQLRKTSSPTVYFDGNANIERPCAPGTLFNERACTCVQDVSIERSESRPGGLTNCTCSNETSCSCSGAMQATAKANSCLPMLALTFDGGKMEDSSNTNQHVGVDGISATREGEAIYNGGGRLVLWRYANLMFPVVFAIKFRFYSTTPSPRKQIIFSNCDPKGGQEPSIEISLDTMFHEVIFKIDTYKGPSKRFTLIYQQNKWTHVDFIYDGERIVGSVDRRTRNIFAGGGIETRPNPIGIGSCNGKDGFKGLLDDIHIYEECIPDDMYGVFMSVLE